MFDHENAVSDWAERVTRRIPALAPHMDEITDHLLAQIEERMAQGETAEQAFAVTITAFGEPGEISRELRSRGRLLGAAQIAGALVWTGGIVASGWAGHDHTNLLLMAYTVTTLLPLSTLEHRARRRANC